MAERRYFKELRIQQFRALVEIGRHGTFTAAADALALSRTSVWQQIRSLEEEFGAELVVVHSHQPQLTNEGRLLLELIGPLVDGFDGVKAAFQDRIGTLKRRLVVATTSSLLNHELRKPVELFRRKHPDVGISLVDRPSTAARELLLRGLADVAVVGRLADTAQETEIRSDTLVHYPFVLATPKKHPLAQKRDFELAELVKFPILCPSAGTNSRIRIDTVLNKAGLSGQIQLALDSHNAALLLTYVEQGLGIALTSMSPELLKQFKTKLHIRDVSEIFGIEEIMLVQRKRRFAMPHVDSFVEIVQREVKPEAK